jgi:hypothetical protein
MTLSELKRRKLFGLSDAGKITGALGRGGRYLADAGKVVKYADLARKVGRVGPGIGLAISLVDLGIDVRKEFRWAGEQAAATERALAAGDRWAEETARADPALDLLGSVAARLGDDLTRLRSGAGAIRADIDVLTWRIDTYDELARQAETALRGWFDG